GINTAIIPYAQGIGFAVPVNMAKQIMDDLVKYGKVNRGWLGIYLQPLSREFASAYGIDTDFGAVVSDVVKGSPAEKAGISRGDVIIEMNGKKIVDHRDVVVGVRQQLAGQKVEIKILRRGVEKKINVTLGNVPSVSAAGVSPAQPAPRVAARLGITVSPVTEETMDEFGFSSDHGVVVTEVQPGSVGNRLRLNRGDVILEINGQKISDTAKWEEILSKAPKNVVFLVLREDRTFFVSANL
ncbi:MAG TPA: PDZ domain-containing protein, partial [Synergistetes bacterium]|nr:PDZ domain-containing protein [Synergistota bacterium]